MTPALTSQPPIQRINFVERAVFVLTYRKMLRIGGLWILFFLVLSASEWTRTIALAKISSHLEVEVNQLKAEREAIMKQVASASAVPQNPKESLMQIFDRTPPWSSLLKELSSKTPRGVWLTQIKTVEKSGPSLPGLTLSGRAGEAGQLTQFLQSLSETTFFDSVVLTSSTKLKEGTGDYEFEADLAIRSATGRGF